jgi:hypothetical protein
MVGRERVEGGSTERGEPQSTHRATVHSSPGRLTQESDAASPPAN